MNTIKFIEPLFDTRYFKKLYKKQINRSLHADLGHIINDWLIINLYSSLNYISETQSSKNFIWTSIHKFLNESVHTTVLHTGLDGTILNQDGYKNVPIHSIHLENFADKKKYFNTCKSRNFMYLWYSVHKGPHELPMHIDKDSPIRYVQCISKETTHSDWRYNGIDLSLKEGDAFIFDPKLPHSIITKKDTESIFLIADCIENTVDEYNV